MNVYSSFGRILWKEYRAQRSVWLALLFGTVLLQSLAFLPREFAPELPPYYPFAVGLTVSVCFAATSVAILFAGEREDETDQWLSQLPIPSRSLMNAKLSAAVIATALFAVAALATGGIVALLSELPRGVVIGEDSFILPRTMIGVFVWGLFFSLQMRSVLRTLLFTATAELITTGSAANVSETFDQRVYFTIVGCVVFADIWLARRWAAGLPAVFGGRNRPLGWRRAIGNAQRPWLLSRVVGSGSPAVRTAGILIWREVRGAAPFLIAWGALGVFCVDLQMRLLLVFLPTHALFLMATPVACGMMTCLGDQRRQSFRFLGERGVSASTVWWCKQLVWVAIAAGVVALFAAWDVMTPGRFEALNQQLGSAGAEVSPAPATRTVPATVPVQLRGMYVGCRQLQALDVFGMDPGSLRHLASDTASPDAGWLWSWAVSLELALFGVGQLASFWIRRTVLAAAVAFMMGLVAVFWHWIAMQGDLPLLWTTWPVAVLCLAATWSTGAEWLLGRHGWRVRTVRAAWLVAIPVLLLVAGRHLRATQVPKVEFRWRTQAATTQVYHRGLSASVNSILGTAHEISVVGNSNRSEAVQLVREVREISEVLRDWTGTPRLAREVVTGDPWRVEVVGREMAGSARRLTADGELDAAWSDIVAGLRVTGFLSTQAANWSDWLNCLIARESLSAAAQDWAADPDQTPDRLAQALGDLKQFSIDAWSPDEMLENRYLIYAQLIERKGLLWERLQRDGQIDFGGRTITMSSLEWLGWTGERERLLRLMTLLTARSMQRSDAGIRAMVPAGGVPLESGVSDREISRWVTTTSSQVGEFAVDLWTDANGYSVVDRMVLEALAEERGTMLIVALDSHRLQTGDFPEQLADLVPEVLEELPRDPYTGGDFGYAPAGFDAPLIPIGEPVVPAEQPLLWSAGLNRAVLAYHAESFESPLGTFPGYRYAASPLDRLSSPGSAPPPPDGGEPDRERVRFIILGAEPYPP